MTQSKYTNLKAARWRRLLVAPAILILLGVCLIQCRGLESAIFPSNDQRQTEAEQESGRKWAGPIELPGVPNLHKVSEDLYRGAQPTAEGMKQLEKLGVKTIVNLRTTGSDRDEIEGTNLEYRHITMKTWNPDDEDIARFLQITTDADRTPVFVHCRHGADRTGTVSAIYRIAVEGWTKDEAITEMTKGGFGYHRIWKDLVEYIREVDIDSLKRSAGLAE
ncbi:MAG: fused DSP-PTPase phosphatase/NAD kinase-like protein [Planctomycetota bacterium]|jgi:protein tyrosine/serine phosphatase